MAWTRQFFGPTGRKKLCCRFRKIEVQNDPNHKNYLGAAPFYKTFNEKWMNSTRERFSPVKGYPRRSIDPQRYRGSRNGENTT